MFTARIVRVINFDDIQNSTSGYGDIPSGYKGFVWNNVGYLHIDQARLWDTNNANNFHYSSIAFKPGQQFVAFNRQKQPMSISFNGNVTIVAMELNSAQAPSISVQLKGSRNGSQQHFLNITIGSQLTNQALNWSNVDKIDFSVTPANHYICVSCISLS